MAKLDKYYSFFLAFLLCLAAGYAFGLIEKTHNKKLFNVLALLIISLNTYDVFQTNISFHRGIFPDKPVFEKSENKEEFLQYFILNNNEERDAGSCLQYSFLKENKGIINWYGNIHLKEHAIPKFFITLGTGEKAVPIEISANPDYRGEVFFLNNNSNSAKLARFTPNIIEIKVVLVTTDILIINQNFSANWKTDYGTLFSWEGLLAIKLDHPGEHSISLKYFPPNFFIGMTVSLFSLLITILLIKGHG